MDQFRTYTRPVRTSSTIWRRKAGGYGGLDFGMVDTSSPKGQVSTKSDQLHGKRGREFMCSGNGVSRVDTGVPPAFPGRLA